MVFIQLYRCVQGSTRPNDRDNPNKQNVRHSCTPDVSSGISSANLFLSCRTPGIHRFPDPRANQHFQSGESKLLATLHPPLPFILVPHLSFLPHPLFLLSFPSPSPPPPSIPEVVTRTDGLAWALDPNSHEHLQNLQRSRCHPRPLPLLPPPPPSPPHPVTARTLQSKKTES